MKTLKLISTAVMLITGIITALTGAVETIIKLVDKLQPIPPRPQAIEKSIGEVFRYLEPAKESFWIEWQGVVILLAGAFLIWLALYLHTKNLNNYHE